MLPTTAPIPAPAAVPRTAPRQGLWRSMIRPANPPTMAPIPAPVVVLGDVPSYVAHPLASTDRTAKTINILTVSSFAHRCVDADTSKTCRAGVLIAKADFKYKIVHTSLGLLFNCNLFNLLVYHLTITEIFDVD